MTTPETDAPGDRDAPEPHAAWSATGSWRAEDLDRLPGLPLRVELLDGAPILPGPRSLFHTRALRLLETSLLGAVPAGWDVLRGMSVRLGPRDRPEVDVVVVRAEAAERPDVTLFVPGDVLLAIEVVSPDSPDSRGRDRGVKPRKYAEAGIRHFWRVEQEDDRVVAYVHAPAFATGSYVPTGVHHERLKVDVSFPVDIDLGAAPRGR